MEIRDWRFPMACPKCQASTGFPIRVTTDVLIVAEIRCGSCRPIWIERASRPPMIFLHADERRDTEHQKKKRAGRGR